AGSRSTFRSSAWAGTARADRRAAGPARARSCPPRWRCRSSPEDAGRAARWPRPAGSRAWSSGRARRTRSISAPPRNVWRPLGDCLDLVLLPVLELARVHQAVGIRQALELCLRRVDPLPAGIVEDERVRIGDRAALAVQLR